MVKSILVLIFSFDKSFELDSNDLDALIWKGDLFNKLK